jgi:hypothetical protein
MALEVDGCPGRSKVVGSACSIFGLKVAGLVWVGHCSIASCGLRPVHTTGRIKVSDS